MLRNILRSKWLKISAALLIMVLLIPLLLRGGIEIVAKTWSPWTPDYEKVDITSILEKSVLSDEDYDILFEQTGLTRLAVDDFLANGEASEILKIQNYFFAEPEYYAKIFHFCIAMFEKESGYYPYANLKDGDIIVSPATYISFIELSHAAIVVDGEFGRIAEAYGYGSTLSTITAPRFFIYPAFVILRPKAGSELGEAAAAYVKENMLGTPYDLLTGIFEEKAPVPLRTTHCSHLPWYAYYMQGIDIDSNGGKIVTPMDILHSDELEVVQVFGMDINDFR